MSGELHEISQAIGKLQAQGSRNAEGLRDVWNKLDEIGKAVARIAARDEGRADHEGRIRRLEDTGNRRAGAVALVGAFVGGFVEWSGHGLWYLFRGHS
jgi:hypothetical protein